MKHLTLAFSRMLEGYAIGIGCVLDLIRGVIALGGSLALFSHIKPENIKPNRSQKRQFSYVISALLSVTLNGQILGAWVFVVDVTRGVVSVTKGVGLLHI